METRKALGKQKAIETLRPKVSADDLNDASQWETVTKDDFDDPSQWGEPIHIPFSEFAKQRPEAAAAAKTESAVSRFLSGLGSNIDPRPLLQMIAEIGQGGMPGALAAGEALSGMAGAQGDQLSKAGASFGQGDYLDAAGHGLAGLLPVIGPGAAHAAEQMEQGNVAGGLGEAAGMLAPMGMARALKVGAPKVAPMMRAAAEKQYTQALAPTTLANKSIASKIVPGLLDKRVSALSREGLQGKVQAQLAEAGDKFDEVLDQISSQTKTTVTAQPPTKPGVPTRITESQRAFPTAPTRVFAAERDAFPAVPDRVKAPVNRPPIITTEKGVRVDATPLLDALEDYKAQFKVGKIVVNRPAVAAAEDLQRIVKQLGNNGSLEKVSFQSLRKLRQILDSNVAHAKGYAGKTLKEGSALDTQKELANAIRGELAKKSPELAKVNAEYSFWKNVDKVVGDTVERTKGQSGGLEKGIATAGGVAGGLAHGGPAGAILYGVMARQFQRIISSPGWKMVSATQKARLADMLAAGQVEDAAFLAGALTAGANIGIVNIDELE